MSATVPILALSVLVVLSLVAKQLAYLLTSTSLQFITAGGRLPREQVGEIESQRAYDAGGERAPRQAEPNCVRPFDEMPVNEMGHVPALRSDLAPNPECESNA